ncbi:hypothetical protein EMCRGX_G011357 [Ephydatia muelleri]
MRTGSFCKGIVLFLSVGTAFSQICTNGDLRLAGGNVINEGRIEICINNVWGTICDDYWSDTDANVACRKLGFSRFNAVAFSNAHFGAGTGSILLDDVICSGSESSLLDCTRASTVYCYTGHQEDAGVRCYIDTPDNNCTYGAVQLVGGTTQYEGRVEVCINNQWGTVCDSSWDSTDATTVCKQLGYAYTGSGIAFSNAQYGVGTGPIFLSNVQCTSSKSTLVLCTSNPILSAPACTHSRDAGVRCEAPCANGDLRLAGGNVINEGRIEICINNVWGTICDDYWSDTDANVACRKLGFSRFNAVAFSNAHFGAGIGSTFLDDVICSGSEASLLDCTRASTVYCYTGHQEDAGVRCYIDTPDANCTYGAVRLVGGTTQYEGRVEVCINNQWGTVCDSSWDSTDATTVCKQLGYAYTGSGIAFSNAQYGVGTGPIFLSNVQCTSSKSTLVLCTSNPILSAPACTHSRDAGVRCEAPCANGDLRLAGGNVINEGRIEICINNVWGTICDDYWSDTDANVACRKLGFSRFNAVAFSNAHFGAGIGSTFLDDVICSGSETSLLDCTRASTVYCYTGHQEDAGVRCYIDTAGTNCTYGAVRLVGGTTQYEGRVEVCINNQWGTVCDSSWDSTDATTVCKQLGYAYTGNGIAFSNAQYGVGTGPIFLSNVQCTSSKSTLVLCTSNPILSAPACTHSRDAGVKCEAPCANGDLRLAGGNVINEGRIEICINNVWGTICDDYWSDSDANVACRKLGFSGQNAVAFSNAHFGAGIGSTFLDDVICSGSESSLLDCTRASTVYCYTGHQEDAGVRCYIDTPGANCTYGAVRLVGGTTQYEGRVEVCINNQWGTVCDSSWDGTDATTVCKQLRYAYTGSGIAFSNAQYGVGTGPIFLSNVQCTTSKSTLVLCTSNPILSAPACTHSRDAGIPSAPCANGDLRLAGGNVINEGRIEICINNVWGTICDDYWSDTDANVACRKLGFSGQNAVAFSNAHFGAGIGSTFLDDVICSGSESSLLDCTRAGTVYCYTGHQEDAGVRCYIDTPDNNCTYGAVRLVEGTTQYEGRVEVCINNQWGTVCDSSWDSTDATTVCKQLGYAYTGSGIAFSNAQYGVGTGPIFLSNVQCTSSKSTLVLCTSNPILSAPACTHSRDAGVRCEAPCANGDLRLAGGNVINEGRIEICINNVWGTICDDYWSDTDANVACRKLGFSGQNAVAFSNAHFGAGIGSTFLDDVICSGSESSLLDCTRASTVYCYTGHQEDAGVRCYINTPGANCTYGAVRLVEGTTQYEGRVEVCINNQWGTVCDSSWDSTDATTVCKQLGYAYTGNGIAFSNAQYGVGTGPIFLSNVQCTSSRSTLVLCTSNPILSAPACTHSRDAGMLWPFSNAHFGAGTGSTFLDDVICSGSESSLLDCTRASTVYCYTGHQEDAGVRCYIDTPGANCTYGAVRLVGGTTQYEGRVEVCINNQWGTVCDSSWDSTDATTVCKQLGYAYTGSGIAFSNAQYGVGTGPIFLSNVQCTSSKSTLVLCTSNPILSAPACTHSRDAGVRCEAPCANGDLRLAGGNVINEGRIEICINNVWGTICDDYWSDTDANVACRKLGFSGQNAVAFSNAHFGAGTGSTFLDDVICSGSETSLLDCTRASTVYCYTGHQEDAGVRCYIDTPGANCAYGTVRLVGGTTQYEGRVEVCINNQWGTVCDSSWDSTDATTVCKQLGYAYTGSGIAFSNAQYGVGTGPIFLSNVQCTSSKSTLVLCTSNPILSAPACTHSRDAGVRCEAPCANGDLRLAGGSVINEGRIEICINNVWGTICDDYWSNTDASVACRKLGFSGQNAVAFSNAYFGAGTGSTFLDDVICSGSESSLLDCTRANTVYCYTGHQEDAGVRCYAANVTCAQGALQLMGGSNQFEGRVEVCINNQWGTVCDSLWDNTDATVVCKQLGYAYTGSAKAYRNAYYGVGAVPIFLRGVQCSGSETALLQCSSANVIKTGPGGCRHLNDSGVMCEASCRTGDLRLSGGNVINEGRIEICINNVWGTICDDYWSDTDANIACRKLGFSGQNAVAFSNAHFGPGIGDILLNNIQCLGSEASLLDCTRDATAVCSTGHYEDAGLRCYVNDTWGGVCNYGAIQLVGGATRNEGRVEVCINNQWGTVCNSSWDSRDAATVCKQLGYSSTGVSRYFGSGSGPIFMSNVQCNNEGLLLTCRSDPLLSVGTCTHGNGAGVRCDAISSSAPESFTTPAIGTSSILQSVRAVLSTPPLQPSVHTSSALAYSSTEMSSSQLISTASMTVSPSTSSSAARNTYIFSTSSVLGASPTETSVPRPRCPSSITSVALANTATVIHTNTIKLTDNVKARFITATEPLIAAYCSLYTSACVPLSIVDGTATNSNTGDVCVVITSSDTNKNGELEVTFFAALDSGNGVLQRTTLQAAIQSAITNGDYANAGYDGVSLKTGDAALQGQDGLPTGVAIGVSSVAVLAAVVTVVIIVIVCVRRRMKKVGHLYFNDQEYLYTGVDAEDTPPLDTTL